MAVVFPTSDSELKHIFRRSGGHVADTLANRTLLLEVANDQAARLEFDEQGNQWAARLLSDGRQVWVRMRDGKIINAGVNLVPRNFNSRTGLNRP